MARETAIELRLFLLHLWKVTAISKFILVFVPAPHLAEDALCEDLLRRVALNS